MSALAVERLRTPVAHRVAAAREAVEAAAAVPVGSLDTDEVSESLASLVALESQVAALKLTVLREADRRDLAEREAATGTDAWAARLTGTTRAVMAGGLWLARLLTERYDATREAFAAGRITEAQVRIIVRAAETLPSEISPAQRTAAETALVDAALAGLAGRRLRTRGRRMLEVIGSDLADAHEAQTLRDEESRAEAETWLTLHDNGNGTWSGRFTVPDLHGQLLATALQRLSAPRRLSRTADGESVVDDTVPGLSFSWSERLGAAFCELVEHLPADRHAPLAATLVVQIDHDRLRDDLAAARLDTGTRISPGEARRLACGAAIIPQVLGGTSQVLDQGRSKRLHTEAQRIALAARHDTCAAQGCERPFAWCEIHHPHAWSAGGSTDLANGVPLCGWHHRRAHDGRYATTYHHDRSVSYRRRR